MLKASRAAINPDHIRCRSSMMRPYDGTRRSLTADQDTLLTNCRVGEYTINFCG